MDTTTTAREQLGQLLDRYDGFALDAQEYEALRDYGYGVSAYAYEEEI